MPQTSATATRPVRRPIGTVTRGTTNPNRLRRMDRWLAGPEATRLRRAEDPLVIDLGYGAAPTTAVESTSASAGCAPMLK